MSKRIATLIPVLAAALVTAGAAQAQSSGSCLNSGMKKITVLGTSPISSSPIDSRQELAAYLDSIRPQIHDIMRRKLLDHRTDALLDALRTGDGVTETTLNPGDVIDWMIFRHEGRVAVGPGPYCIATQRSYDAFRVELVEERQVGGSIERTTETFIIPKICANLGFVGTTTETVAGPVPGESEPGVTPTPTPAPTPAPETPTPPATDPAAPATPTTPPATPSTPATPTPAVSPDPDARRGGGPGRDSRWTVRAFPLRLNADGDTSDRTTVDFFEREILSVDGGNGFGVSAEYRANDRWGIEAAALRAEIDALLVFDSLTEWLKARDDEEMTAFTIGPNLHFTPNKPVDLYVGAFIGLAQFSDPTFDLGGAVGTVSREFDDEFVFGLQLGLDVPFGASGWAFHTSARLMDLALEGPETDLDLDPLIGAIGLAYNF